MNNSEGQTQEPVGGMKWVKLSERKPKVPKTFVVRKNNGHVFTCPWFLNSFNDGDPDIIEWLDDNFTSPPAPIKTEGEDVESILDAYREFIVRTGLIDRKNLQDWVKNLPPAPLSPVGIDVDPEELWDEFSEMIDSDISDLEYFAGRCVITHDSFNKLINKIKAGYSASLPQSSTEEEKIKPIRELTEDDCGTWFLFYNSHAGWWEKEICHGMDRIYSGWTHFTQLPDTPTNL